MSRKIDTRNAGIDSMKLVAAFLVVAIHVSPLQSINATADFIFTRIIARVAVPFFFMVSGYFVLADSKRRNGKAIRFLRKTAWIYFAATLLYLPVQFYAGKLKALSLSGIGKALFLDGTFYHLWYLPAAMTGMLLCIFFLRIAGERVALILSIFLYGFGLLGDSYFGLVKMIPPMETVYEALFRIFSYTRNGFFFAPLFLMLGCILAGKKKDNDCFVLSLLFGVLMLAEGMVLHHFKWQRHDSMYLFLPLLMYFLFREIQAWGHQMDADCRKSVLKEISPGDLAMLIYIIHPMVLIVLRGVSKPLGLYGLCVENTLVCYILVSIISAFSAWLFLFLGKKCKEKKKVSVGTQKDRAWIEIHPENLSRNVREIQSLLPRQCRFMAVVKANAYGHGDALIAKYLYQMGIRCFAVASLDEGIHLRKQGIKGEILILGYTSPENAGCLAKYDLIQTVVSEAYAKSLNETKVRVRVHIKIDTGMHRLGEDWRNRENIFQILKYPNLKTEGVFSHLCMADGRDEEAVSYTRAQIDHFGSVLTALKREVPHGLKAHLQSSYGTVNYPCLQCSYARIGIMMYGIKSNRLDQTVEKPDLRPVLSLKARVAQVKQLLEGESVGYGCSFKAPCDMLLAAVTIGYADGYPRNLSGKGVVLIRGKRAPVIGRICMDQLTVDISGIEGVRAGDEVTLIGRDGEAVISAEEVAALSGTITNELLSRMGARLGRIVAENRKGTACPLVKK